MTKSQIERETELAQEGIAEIIAEEEAEKETTSPNIALAQLISVGHALGVDFASLLPRRRERRDAEWYASHPEEALALQARLDAAEVKRTKRRARNLKEKP